MIRWLNILIIFHLFLPALFGATIQVPLDYPSIQEAIDASENGDLILVDPGTYEEQIIFNGKAVTVLSVAGPEETVIEVHWSTTGSAVSFVDGEDHQSILDGFTLTHDFTTLPRGILCIDSSPIIRNNIIHDFVITSSGSTTRHGAGIYLENSDAIIENNIIRNNWLTTDCGGNGVGIGCAGTGSPTIINNIIKDNILYSSPDWSSSHGGGIACMDQTAPLIMNNIIENNIVDFYSRYVGHSASGGGIYCNGTGEVRIINNIIRNNEVYVTGPFSYVGVAGGGLYIDNSNTTISNCVVYDNIAHFYGGAFSAHGGGIFLDSVAVIKNTIFWENYAMTYGHQIHAPFANPTIEYCCVQNGWPGTGNIDLDPMFIDADNGDFHLPFNSPCRNAGDNNIIRSIDFDYEGDPRVAWGDIVDMGADEFYTHLYCTGDFYPDGSIEGKLVGIPGKTPTALFIGFDVRDPAAHTAYGDFYIQPPWFLVPLIPIPANGILTLPATVPSSSTPPYDVFVQGLVGLDSDSLTNLCVLEIRMFEE